MSINKKDRSIYGNPPEQQKIYNQRRTINRLEKENKQLKDNWNKLKEYVNEVGSPFTNGWNYIQIEDKIIYVEDVLDKMQELEKGE